MHPKYLWEAVVERARVKTGGLYADFYDEQGNWRYEKTAADPAAVEQLIAERNKALVQFPPKKPAHSVRRDVQIAEARKAL